MQILSLFFLSLFLLFGFINAAAVEKTSQPKQTQINKAELRNKIMNPFSDIWIISYSNAFHIIDTGNSNKAVNQTKIKFKTGLPVAQDTTLLLGLRTGVRLDSSGGDFLGLNFETTSLNIKIAKKINKSYSYAFGGAITLPNSEDYNNAETLNSDVTFAPNLYLRYNGSSFDAHVGIMHNIDIVNTDNINQSSTRMFIGLAIPILDSSDISIGTAVKYDWTQKNKNRLDAPFFVGYNFLTNFLRHPVQLRLGAGTNIIKASDSNSETFFFIGIAPILKY